MSVTTAIVTLLLADGTYSGLVGTALYPSVLPGQVTLPASTYNVVAGTGGDTTGPDLIMTRIQFDSYASTFNVAEQIGNSIYNALRRYSSEATTPKIADIKMDYRQTTYGDEANAYRDIMDLKIWHNGM